MPRNCGCGGRCDCVIVGGSGAAVTGTGRADSPYVVALESGGGSGGGWDPGDVKWSARTAAPAGWLVCDGAAVSRVTYADLFDAIGALYGDGDGTTTFNLPDYTGRFMLGADSDHPAGSTGGAAERTLTQAQMPAHSHGINHDHPPATTSHAGAHDHATSSSTDQTSTRDTGHFQRAGTTGSVTNRNLIINDGSGDHTHSLDVPAFTGDSTAAGGGQPVSILPPYTTALPLIKT